MRKAIYPGSFDPPTLGHLDVIERAARLFDEVVVAVGVNRAKPGFMDPEERIEAIQCMTKHLENVRADSFEGLLVEYAEAQNARAIVRGLRMVSDFDFEFQMAIANRRMDPQIETILMMTKWEYSYISSTVVREIAILDGPFDQFVPESVVPVIQKSLNRRKS